MKFISNFILLVERAIRWFIFSITLFVMFYLVVHSLMMFFASGIPQITNWPKSSDVLATSIAGWKVYRNLMYLLLIFDLPIVGLSVLIREKIRRYIFGAQVCGHLVWFAKPSDIFLCSLWIDF